MSERALKSYPLLQRLAQEFEALSLPIIVKLGYVVDGGGPADREHLWFRAHTLGKDSIRATLLSRPLGVSSLKEGDCGEHPLEFLSGWALVTPEGLASSYDSLSIRMMRDESILSQSMEHAAAPTQA